ncbi:MAG: OmpA family protein [Sphingobacteriales bacterium]|nr:MAG: OmpA family protein [Sphingobacteriales bacterium]
MRKVFVSIVLFFIVFIPLIAQVSTVSSDTDWEKQQAFLSGSYEAEIIIRIGDVDNLGFGWPEGFDPFCGRMTEAHSYPWEINPNDLPGFDRILLSSKFNPSKEQTCGTDGYTISYDSNTSKPVVFNLPTDIAKGTVVKNAWVQLFIDDFQSPSFCSRFQVTINGNRFNEAEKIINAIDQTGPVGKLISIPVPEDFYALITEGKSLRFLIDEINGAGDGFALDFIRLLVNRKYENTCKGNVRGVVLDQESGNPVAGAKVWSSNYTASTTNSNGNFELKDIPAGFEILTASANGYADGTGMADIGEGDDNAEVTIYLQKGGTTILFDNQKIAIGEAVSLKNIMFDLAKADIKPASKPELDKVVALLKANPTAEIELSGHTSSEGEAEYNRSLSYRRVKACKDYIVSNGIDSGRIVAIGYGPDRPVAPNDTETNRAKNRRVEMRLIKY